MTGRLRFYDGAMAWGVIVADDGALYMVQGQVVSGPPLREGELLRFEPATGPGGLRATSIQRLSAGARGTTTAPR